ncbi:MAG: RsiV family protein [Butyrivibrio sp.]|uniref:RsiV family protein n=1 Tax=Butyrivibrio sp. TaxID=28121 RepID=UPI0025DEA7D7|nr:RsiV family protein [Butyrivibrio sp.]MCR5771039.1 RsiV family protein [Butyrivibrio sp.]
MTKQLKFARSCSVALIASSLILSSCSSPDLKNKSQDDESQNLASAAAEGESAEVDNSASLSSTTEDATASDEDDNSLNSNGCINLGSKSRNILDNTLIKEDDNYFYYVIYSKLWRTSKDNPDDTVCLFPQDDSKYTINYNYKFALYNGNVYVLAQSTEDYNEYVFRIDSGGNASMLSFENEVKYSADIDIYNDTFYLYSFDSDNDMILEGYKLGDDGSLGEAYNEFENLDFEFEDGWVPVYTRFGSYKCSPSSIGFYGGIYCMDNAGNKSKLCFISADDTSSKTEIAEIDDGNVVALTKDKLVMLNNDYLGKYIYSIDLKTGERTDILTKESFVSLGYAHSTDVEVIDYDDENIFLKIDQPLAEDPVPDLVYDFVKVSLTDGQSELLCSITPGDDSPIDNANLIYNFTSKGLTYITFVYSNYYLCYRPYGEMNIENVLVAQDPDYGSDLIELEEYDITLSTSHSAYFYTDDNFDIMAFRSDLVIPQLPATSDEFIEFNDNIMENLDVADMAQSSVEDAKMNAEAYDSSSEYSPMDLYPYYYTYNYTGLEYHDSRYVCLSTSDYEYWGGAHGMGWEYSYTLDMQEGKILKLSDVISQSQAEFVELVCNHVTDLNEGSLFLTYEETADQIRSSYTDNDFNWFLTPDGIAVRFSSYEIAPYSEGYPVITVPYSEVSLLIGLEV